MFLNWFSFDPKIGCDRPESIILDVPLGIETKMELFRAYHFGLGFPFYFGYNWDAFWDIISSREHLEAPLVIVRHRDIPMIKSLELCQTYLEILIDSVIDLKPPPQSMHSKMIVVFPTFCKEKLKNLPHSQSWLDKHAKRLTCPHLFGPRVN